MTATADAMPIFLYNEHGDMASYISTRYSESKGGLLTIINQLRHHPSEKIRVIIGPCSRTYTRALDKFDCLFNENAVLKDGSKPTYYYDIDSPWFSYDQVKQEGTIDYIQFVTHLCQIAGVTDITDTGLSSKQTKMSSAELTYPSLTSQQKKQRESARREGYPTVPRTASVITHSR